MEKFLLAERLNNFKACASFLGTPSPYLYKRARLN